MKTVYYITWRNGIEASYPTTSYEEALAKMRYAREHYPDEKFVLVETKE